MGPRDPGNLAMFFTLLDIISSLVSIGGGGGGGWGGG